MPPDAAIIVCGGLNVQQHSDKRLISWLRKVARRGNDIGAVCTGAHVLAESGLLDGYKCTIHWENLPGFTEAFPDIEATGGLFEIDRDRFTSAGGTTAIDMMLTMIASQHGPDLASQVAEAVLAFAHPPPQRTPAHVAARPHRRATSEACRHHREDGGESGRASVAQPCWQSRQAFPPASSSGCSAAMSTARRSATIWNCA